MDFALGAVCALASVGAGWLLRMAWERHTAPKPLKPLPRHFKLPPSAIDAFHKAAAELRAAQPSNVTVRPSARRPDVQQPRERP